MFYSQTLLSKKGPLGAIRVAAYFFKRLKKPHVQDTDIAFSVDKILKDEMPVLTYRVLGYLLLGIVRIYSKKVEYLFDDCQEVLIGVKNFVVQTKEDLPVGTQRAPYFSITLPESFELDAFDLEVLDVDETIEGNVLPHEEITLKDNAQENAITRQYATDMFFCEEFAGSSNPCSSNYLPLEGVVSSYWMDVHLRNSINIDSLIASMEKLQENRSQEVCVDVRMNYAVEREPQIADKPYVEANQDNREKIENSEILSSKDGIQGVAITEKLHECGENGGNLVRPSGIEGGPADHEQLDGEEITMVSESELLEKEDNQGNREKIEDRKILSSKDRIQGAAIREKLQECGENGANLVSSSGIEGGPANNVQLDGEDIMMVSESKLLEKEDNQDNREKLKDPQMLSSKDGIQGAAITEKLQDSRENGMNLVRSSGIEGGPADHVQPDGEDIQIDPQQIMVSESEQTENETCQVTGQDDNLSNLQAEMEKLRDNTCSQVEAMDTVVFEAKEPQEHVEPLVEENRDDVEERLPEMPESIRSCIFGEGSSLSIEFDKTADIKVPDHLDAATLQFTSIPTPATRECSSQRTRAATPQFASIPTPAAATLQFASIPTPATKERARIARISGKRKCVYDDVVVLPSKVLRESIHDASDLVSKRRKVPHAALSVWRASQMFHHVFFEPLLPCVSSELSSLFSKKKLKIITSVEAVEPLKELNIPEIPTIGISEQICIAPETPVQRSTFAKSFESPVSPQTPNNDRVRLELFENVEQEPAPIRVEGPDLCPIDEMINSGDEDNNEFDGWSRRTRKVARYLHRSFLDQKEQGDEEVVNLLQVVKGRTKKESARFFYEILVLSSKGYVGVKQDDGYGDILVRKLQLPNMEPNL